MSNPGPLATPGRTLSLTVVTNSIRTIAPHTTFRDDPRAYMDAEVEALKAPLLYGEKVLLRSYLFDVATMAAGYETYSRMPLHATNVPVSFVANSSPETLSAYGLDPSRLPIAEARELLRTVGQLETQEFFRAMFDFRETHYEALRPAARAIFDSAASFTVDVEGQLQRLAPAVDQGLLEVGGWSPNPPGLFEPEQRYIDRAGNALLEAVVTATSPLVLDAGAGVTLRQPGPTDRELQLAQELLRPLPAFSLADIDEIMDIRKELASPLRRFRVEVAELATAIENDGDVAEQVNSVWRKSIRPALDELDELTQENSYLRQLADKVTEAKTLLPASATFALGIGGLTGVAQVAAAAASVGAIPLEALRAKVKDGRALQRKRLYFLWKLSQRGQ